MPGLDTPAAFQKTGAVPITDIERTYDPDQPIVVINADTRKRHLIWSELDANPPNPANVNLIIRPAVNFEEGERYIVALRNLKRRERQARSRRQQPFRVYRDRLTSDRPRRRGAPAAHGAHLPHARAGGHRTATSLYLAWDFTVASERNLSERALSIRDDAFAQLGDTNLSDLQVQGSAPQFTVTRLPTACTATTDGCQRREDTQIARNVDGTVRRPLLPEPAGLPARRALHLPAGSIGAAAHPRQHGCSPNFTCLIPRAAVGRRRRSTPARPSLYGHGLLGSAERDHGRQHQGDGERAQLRVLRHRLGRACRPRTSRTSRTILGDLSNFPTLPDRAQQGFLNFMYLGRLMIHPHGLHAQRRVPGHQGRQRSR